MHTACVWSEKLPFAEYSVVKEREMQIAKCRWQIEFPPNKQSGEYRARTGDLLVANQALSQLS